MLTNFKNKKVIVMGLGLHGGGLSVAKWFFSRGAEVIVTDMKSAEQLQESIEKLDQYTREYRLAHSEEKFHSIEYVLGAHREQDFKTADLVVQNPGVPAANPFLAIARSNGVPVENEASLFFLLTPGTKKIGVTGTRGKSTTTTLIYEMVKCFDDRAFIAGNIATTTLFEVIDRVMAAEERGEPIPVVIELSSLQLELLAYHKMSPNIAVMTNMFADHLNFYQTMEEYTAAKEHIFRYQTSDDYVIFNYDNAITRRLGQGDVPGKRYWFSLDKKPVNPGVYIEEVMYRGIEERFIMFFDGKTARKVVRVKDIALSGEHNLANVLAAVAATKLFGVSDDCIKKVVKTFKGLPFRIEHRATIQGRDLINDTTATSPDGARVALETIWAKQADKKKRIVLIAGGADKNLSFDDLAPVIKKTCKTIILLSGTATPKLVSALGSEGYTSGMEMANSMREAFEKAWRASAKGDTILLSPGAASFGMFVNEYDRGRQFNALVEEMQGRE